MAPSPEQPMDIDGPTGKLCTWIHALTLADIPAEVQTRAKYLLLDGIACGLVGAHLPWSETAANAIFEMESAGSATIIGYEKVINLQFFRAPIYLLKEQMLI